MIALPIVAALFLAGFVANVVTGEVTLADSLIQWNIAAFALAMFWFARRQARLSGQLLVFLRQNARAIREGAASYRGTAITYATRLHGYDLVTSLLIASFRLPSRLVVEGTPDRGLRTTCFVFSLVFGWWGIPWGPIWTVKALAGNVRRSRAYTVGELLEGASPVSLAPARAVLGRRK